MKTNPFFKSRARQGITWRRQIIIFLSSPFLPQVWHFVYLSSLFFFIFLDKNVWDIWNNIKKTFVRNIWCKIRLKIVCNKYDLRFIITNIAHKEIQWRTTFIQTTTDAFVATEKFIATIQTQSIIWYPFCN